MSDLLRSISGSPVQPRTAEETPQPQEITLEPATPAGITDLASGIETSTGNNLFTQATFQDKPIQFDQNGMEQLQNLRSTLEQTKKSQDDLDKSMKEWEEKLNSVGDDAQLANVDLQNMLQKQQQTLQMMSNISKMLFDSAMAVVRKLGG